MTEPKRGGGFFLTVFGLISAFFILFLAVVYLVSKKANPVMLDDQGRPPQTQRS